MATCWALRCSSFAFDWRMCLLRFPSSSKHGCVVGQLISRKNSLCTSLCTPFAPRLHPLLCLTRLHYLWFRLAREKMEKFFHLCLFLLMSTYSRRTSHELTERMKPLGFQYFDVFLFSFLLKNVLIHVFQFSQVCKFIFVLKRCTGVATGCNGMQRAWWSQVRAT